MTQINRQKQGGVVYIAPSMSVLDVETEGLLCSSYDRADAGYDNENDLSEI